MSLAHFYLGIDPGLLGALAIVDDKGRAQVFDAPVLVTTTRRNGHVKPKREYELVQMMRLLRRFAAPVHSIAILERGGARPDQGVVSMETLGYGRGIWEMSLTWAAIPYTRVSPIKWKNAMLEGVGHDKEASVLRAQQLFPHVDLTTTRGAVRDGRAEALLLAEYGRRQHAQGKL